MGHIVNAKEEIYHALAERKSRSPEGAPINENLLAILRRLYSEGEAMVGSKFPLVPFSLEKIVATTGMEETKLKGILESMSDKGLVMDFPRRDSFFYMLAPVVVGFFRVYLYAHRGSGRDEGVGRTL